MRRLLAAALPVAAVAMVAAASFLPGDSTTAGAAPRPVDVVESTYACPAGSIITLGAGQLRAGDSRTVRVVPDGTADDDLQDAGAWSTASFDAAGLIVTETGRGAGPSGFFAGRAPAKGGGGLVVGRCPGVVDDAWFMGLGSGEKHFSTLILTNLSSTPAVADLRLWGTEGRVEAVDAAGITLDPYEVRRIPLADLAAGEPALGIQVQRSRGSLSAVVNDSSTSTFAGTEPIGATQAPRRDQVVGGIAGGARGKTLLLLNPGDETARVDVDVLADGGTFAGRGLQDVKVEPGQLREVEVPESAGSGGQAFHLVSDQPVTASVRMSPNDQDYAIAEATPLLDGDALVPVDLGRGVSIPKLVLTAPGRTATVEVEAFDESMRSLGSSTVGVDGGTTVRVDAVDQDEDFADDVAYVVVRGAGDVLGGATYVDGDGVSSLALEAAPVAVEAPAVRRADG